MGSLDFMNEKPEIDQYSLDCCQGARYISRVKFIPGDNTQRLWQDGD